MSTLESAPRKLRRDAVHAVRETGKAAQQVDFGNGRSGRGGEKCRRHQQAGDEGATHASHDILLHPGRPVGNRVTLSAGTEPSARARTRKKKEPNRPCFSCGLKES